MTVADVDSAAFRGRHDVTAPVAVIAPPVVPAHLASPTKVGGGQPTVNANGSGWQTTAVCMVTLSALALWAVLFALVLSAIQERRSQHELLGSFQEQLALQTAPIAGPIRRGAPVALLSIARIGLRDVVVAEGTSSGDLEAGPGHRRDTVLPGEVGVSVVMGRSALFGAPFGRLVELHRGDAVEVTTGQGTFRYLVTGVRRRGDPLPYPIAAGSGRLTLETSTSMRSGFFPGRQTVFVDATLDEAAPGDAGRPATIASSEAPMRGDPASLVSLVVSLQLLMVAIVFIAWGRANWEPVPTLLVACPVVVATLWMATENAARLLPNIL